MRKFLSAAAAALLLTSLAGCIDPGPVKTPVPTPSATPVFASDEEALAAAEAAYAAYQVVEDAIFAEGGANPERLTAVASRDFLDASLAGFDSIRSKGWRSVGKSAITSVDLQAYDPTASDIDIITVYLCDDVSAVDVLDSSGVSVVSPQRPDRTLFEVRFDLEPVSKALLVASRDVWGDGQC